MVGRDQLKLKMAPEHFLAENITLIKSYREQSFIVYMDMTPLITLNSTGDITLSIQKQPNNMGHTFGSLIFVLRERLFGYLLIA